MTRRKLTLRYPRTLSDGPVLRRETMETYQLAEQLLEAARLQGENLLIRAHQEAERLGEIAQAEAWAEVWRQADVLLEDWQHQRQQMWTDITSTAETLVGQVFQQLQGEQPVHARVRAVIHHLMISQTDEQAGVVYAHQDWLEPIKLQLNDAQARWSVRSDPELAPETVCLRTEHGEFYLSWGRLIDILWPTKGRGPS